MKRFTKTLVFAILASMLLFTSCSTGNDIDEQADSDVNSESANKVSIEADENVFYNCLETEDTVYCIDINSLYAVSKNDETIRRIFKCDREDETISFLKSSNSKSRSDCAFASFSSTSA